MNDYCIVTFDSDFYDLSLVRGTPPKIIWLLTGNTSTKSLEKRGYIDYYLGTLKEGLQVLPHLASAVYQLVLKVVGEGRDKD